MWFKRLSLAALAAASSQLALASPASSVLQFEGAVKGTTCSISVGGVETPNPATVILAPAKLEELRDTGWGDGAEFDIDLKNCAAYGTKVNVMLQGANGTTVSGRYNLDNMATIDPAEHVKLTIFRPDSKDPSSWYSVNLDWPYPPANMWTDIRKEKLQLSAAYRLESSNRDKATPGNFEAAMQFTVVYQ